MTTPGICPRRIFFHPFRAEDPKWSRLQKFESLDLFQHTSLLSIPQVLFYHVAGQRSVAYQLLLFCVVFYVL